MATLHADSTTVRPAADKRPQLLALSGGGYRGLFTARILEHIETKYGGPLRSRFCIIAGTSAGALIAAALANGIAASTIRAAFEQHGKTIFPRGALTFARQLLIAPYRQDGLSQALDVIFKDHPGALDAALADQPLPLLVTAVSVSEHRARVFGGKGLGDPLPYAITLREALLSSAAAPTFFPMRHPAGAERLVDGGLVANAPELVALAYGRRALALDLHALHLLSIGTAAPQLAASPGGSLRKGIFRSLFSTRGVVQMTLDGQEDLATRLARDLLGERYYRADNNPAVGSDDARKIASMDRADTESTSTLLALADRRFNELHADARFRAFF